MGALHKTLIVVPCFNEERRFERAAFETALAAQPDLGFVLVDDGSRDRTLDVLNGLSSAVPNRVHVLALGTNRGKAEAVRRGVLRAAEIGAEFVGYFDADLSTPLEAVPAFVARFADPEVLLVMGSRVRLLGRNIKRGWVRHYVGRVFATYAGHALELAVYDTQCGAKVFRVSPPMMRLFERPFGLNWAFDVELIARLVGLERLGLCNVERAVVELPLEEWVDVGGSNLNLRQVPGLLLELARLRAIVMRERRG
jgi:glycosyltransferase involved in cell wall biosynthesis